jgi:hypothetical protein
LAVDSFLVARCNMVHMDMLAKLATWWCKQTAMTARAVSVDVGSAMHRVLDFLG